MSTPLPPWPYPRWIAHRGAGKLAPENTLAAFRLGARHGYRMFECDAKLSSDGVLFLLHDATLERTTNGHGAAGERSMGELAQLDAGGWHSRAYAGEAMPTLEALARYCLANGHHLNVEIKPTPGQELATGRAVGELLARIWPATAVPPLLTSFKPAALTGARETAPALRAGAWARLRALRLWRWTSRTMIRIRTASTASTPSQMPQTSSVRTAANSTLSPLVEKVR